MLVLLLDIHSQINTRFWWVPFVTIYTSIKQSLLSLSLINSVLCVVCASLSDVFFLPSSSIHVYPTRYDASKNIVTQTHTTHMRISSALTCAINRYQALVALSVCKVMHNIYYCRIYECFLHLISVRDKILHCMERKVEIKQNVELSKDEENESFQKLLVMHDWL